MRATPQGHSSYLQCQLILVQDDYGALEPAISGKIMELHHKKHHQTYVNSYNDASEKFAAAESSSDIAAQITLLPLVNFHGGGHLNHTLFWENLAPKSSGGGEPPSGALKDAIDHTYGGLDRMKKQFNAALAGVQGSGWAWLVKDKETGQISIRAYAVRKRTRIRRSVSLLTCFWAGPESRSGCGEVYPSTWYRRMGARILVSGG